MWLPAAVFLLVFNCSSRASGQKGDEVDQWVTDRYAKALDLLLGQAGSQEPLPRDTKWSITVRIVAEDKEEPETQFIMTRLDGGEVRVTYLAPRGRSIFAHLKVLHKNSPKSALEEIVQRVPMNRAILNSARMPELKELAGKLEEVQVAPVFEGSLYMHPTVYRFEASSRWGARASLFLDGPGRMASQQPNALLKWAEKCRIRFGQVPFTGGSANR
jgi:hypothetical protein